MNAKIRKIFWILSGIIIPTQIAACRPVSGQCSKDTETLCLEVDLQDRSVVPKRLKLSLSSMSGPQVFDFDAQEVWRTRPYFVEIKFPPNVPDSLDVEAIGSNDDAGAAQGMPVARTLVSVQPRTASRPTRLVLTPVPGGMGDDMSGDLGPVDLATPPVDLTNPDLATPPFIWTNVTPASAPAKLLAVSGVAAASSTIYAVGASATLLKSIGGSTFASAVGPPVGASDFTALWVQSAMELWLADASGKVFMSSDGANTAGNWADKMSGETIAMRAISGSAGRNSLYIGGDQSSRALVLNPLSSTIWTASVASCTQGSKLLGIWASPNYVLFAGEGFKLAKATNPAVACTSLSQMGFAGLPNVTAVHGISDTVAFAITNDGQLGMTDLTATNNRITRAGSVGTATFTGLWVKSATEVWISASSRVYLWNGSSFADRTSNLPGGYVWTGIWGDGNGGLWLVGYQGTVGAIYKH